MFWYWKKSLLLFKIEIQVPTKAEMKDACAAVTHRLGLEQQAALSMYVPLSCIPQLTITVRIRYKLAQFNQ